MPSHVSTIAPARWHPPPPRRKRAGGEPRQKGLHRPRAPTEVARTAKRPLPTRRSCHDCSCRPASGPPASAASSPQAFDNRARRKLLRPSTTGLEGSPGKLLRPSTRPGRNPSQAFDAFGPKKPHHGAAAAALYSSERAPRALMDAEPAAAWAIASALRGGAAAAAACHARVPECERASTQWPSSTQRPRSTQRLEQHTAAEQHTTARVKGLQQLSGRAAAAAATCVPRDLPRSPTSSHVLACDLPRSRVISHTDEVLVLVYYCQSTNKHP